MDKRYIKEIDSINQKVHPSYLLINKKSYVRFKMHGLHYEGNTYYHLWHSTLYRCNFRDAKRANEFNNTNQNDLTCGSIFQLFKGSKRCLNLIIGTIKSRVVNTKKLDRYKANR